MTDINQDILIHYGKLGMKWGRRTTNIEPSTNRTTLSKGTEIQNISVGKRDLSKTKSLYVSYTKKDNEFYKTVFASELQFEGKPFNNVFSLKKDITVASEKDAIDAFKKLYEKNPSRMIKAMATGKRDSSIADTLALKLFNKDKSEKYVKNISKKGEDWIQSKGYEHFNTALGGDNKLRNSYFLELGKKGLHAAVDYNDVKKVSAEKPLVIFDAQKVLNIKSQIPLTESELNLASEAYKNLILGG